MNQSPPSAVDGQNDDVDELHHIIRISSDLLNFLLDVIENTLGSFPRPEGSLGPSDLSRNVIANVHYGRLLTTRLTRPASPAPCRLFPGAYSAASRRRALTLRA